MNPTVATTPGPVLRDIHLPPPPGWWPPAPGWWLLAIVVLAALAWLAVHLYRMQQRRRRRRAVMAELERSIDAARGNPATLASALSRFLRRLARQLRPGAEALSGERWLEYLDRGAASDEFSRGIGRVLIEAPYRTAMPYDTAALTALVRRWTRRVLDAEIAHA